MQTETHKTPTLTAESILDILTSLQEKYYKEEVDRYGLLLDEVMNYIDDIVVGLKAGITLSESEKWKVYHELSREDLKEDIHVILSNEEVYTEEMIAQIPEVWYDEVIAYYTHCTYKDDILQQYLHEAIERANKIIDIPSKLQGGNKMSTQERIIGDSIVTDCGITPELLSAIQSMVQTMGYTNVYFENCSPSDTITQSKSLEVRLPQYEFNYETGCYCLIYKKGYIFHPTISATMRDLRQVAKDLQLRVPKGMKKYYLRWIINEEIDRLNALLS